MYECTHAATQAMKMKTWEDDKSGRLLMQLKGIGVEGAKKLVAAGIVTLQDVVSTSHT